MGLLRYPVGEAGLVTRCGMPEQARSPRLGREPMKCLPLGSRRFRGAAADALVAIGLATVSACASLSPAGEGDRTASASLGSLTLSGPTFGEATLHPTACLTGERELFLGFDLRDASAGVVTRLIVDPAAGPIVRVFAISAPFDKSVLFHREDCRVLHFSLESTGWLINRIQQLDVSMDLDCRLPSGERILGNASDARCL
jgi:hypothetical protein